MTVLKMQQEIKVTDLKRIRVETNIGNFNQTDGKCMCDCTVTVPFLSKCSDASDSRNWFYKFLCRTADNLNNLNNTDTKRYTRNII